ncbi:MAG TPA: hypothetical protein VME45_12875 [Stellaceae bacterium]|nr:hypothetical protein [Stellaceae bacterium]
MTTWSLAPQTAGPLICGLLTFIFVLGIIGVGLARVLSALVVAIIALFALETFAEIASSQSLLMDLSGAAAGIVVGLALGHFVGFKGFQHLRDSWRLVLNQIIGDYRILVVFIAIAVAVLITLVFAHLRVDEKSTTFWHGFYESWTASIVFFAILGVAGTIVSLYRPEKDAFEAKVRILCGGAMGSEVDYIRENITKIGYFAESVVRTYTIVDWDPGRRAYEIEVSHHSVNRNFFDDDASDTGRFALTPDPLGDPPLDPVGRLIEVNVDGKQVFGAEDIPLAGIDQKWPVPLRKGGRVQVLVRHRAWYGVTVTHRFRPARFAKTVTVKLRSELPTVKPMFSATVYQREVVDFRRNEAGAKVLHQKALDPSITYEHIPSARNCLPNQPAFEFELKPP